MWQKLKRWLGCSQPPAVVEKDQPTGEFYVTGIAPCFNSVLSEHQALLHRYNWLHKLLIASIQNINMQYMFIDRKDIDKVDSGRYKLVVTEYGDESYQISVEFLPNKAR